MGWVLEEPLPTLLVGITLTLLLGMLIGPTSRKWAWGTALCTALGTAALLFVERIVVTDREEVEATLLAAAEAVQQNDLNALQRLIDATASEARDKARSAFREFSFKRAKIASDLRVDLHHDQQPATAEARFTATAKVVPKRQQFVHDQFVQRLAVQLVRRGDQWLITGATMRK